MIFVILLLLLFVGFIYLYNRTDNEAFIPCFVISGFVLAVLLICDLIMYCQYVSAYSTLTVIKTQQTIQQKQAENIVASLRVEVEKYLQHEEATLTGLTPTNVQTLLVQYPQLASAPTVVKLMDDITKLNTYYYSLLSKEQELIANITYFKVNVFYIGPTALP